MKTILALLAALTLVGCAPAVQWSIEDRDAALDACLKRGDGWRYCAHDVDSFERLFRGYPELARGE